MTSTGLQASPRTVGPLLAATLGLAGLSGLIDAGCGDTAESPLVVGVSPAAAYTDRSVVLRVDAAQVRPAVRLDVKRGTLAANLSSMRMTLIPESSAAAGSSAMRLETVDWDGADSYWVTTPPALPAGRYTLELVDPRGRTARLPGAFDALGPDPAAPTITIYPLTTDGYIAAGSPVKAEIVADDGALGGMASVEWSAGSNDSGACAPPQPGDADWNVRVRPPTQIKCVATFNAPKLDPGDPTVLPFLFRVTARDIAGHVADLEVPLRLAKPPLIFSISDTVGALGGYQPFTVRGQHFLPGSRALIGGIPIVGVFPGGDLLDEQSIVGWTPPHDRAETVPVVVESPGDGMVMTAAASFTYLPPPRPRDIRPAAGPARGGIMVTVRGNDFRTGMVVYVGATRETRRPLGKQRFVITQNQLVGCLPPGAVGSASIWTYDPVTGDGELPGVFTYQDDTGSPSSSDPTCQ